jgi:hypothetical protein
MSREQVIPDCVTDCGRFRSRHKRNPPKFVALQLRPRDHPCDCGVNLFGRVAFREERTV